MLGDCWTASRDFEDFKKIGGLRDAKLASISATLEISRRIVRQVLTMYARIKGSGIMLILKGVSKEKDLTFGYSKSQRSQCV